MQSPLVLIRAARSLVFLCLLASPLPLSAQAPAILRGQVTDAVTGAPLPNVQVRIEGSSAAAVTRATGEYSFAVPAGAQTVTTRRVGYAPIRRQLNIAGGATVTENFALRVVAVTLGEVVVTGTAAPTTRIQLGNTIETVAGEEITEAPGVTAIDQALQGKVTGAWISENSGQPGAGVSIRLRGTNSILGGAEPLFVVDGVIVDNSSDALVGLGANATRQGSALTNRMADLDPADVERIEVLKGAAAAALYGARANNGVIQIFTKRGATGGPQVSFSSDLTFGSTPKKYDLNMHPQAGWTDVLFGPAPAVGAPVQRFDIQDQIFRDAVSTNNRLSLSGGTGGTTYYLGAGYQREEGILQSTDYTRRSARVNLGHRFSDRIELAARANFIQSLAQFMPEGEQTQGVLTSIVFTPTSINPNFDANLGRFPYNPVLGANPLDVIANWEAPERVTRLVGGFDVSYRPIRDVTLSFLTGIDDFRREVRYFIPQFATSATSAGSIQNPVQFSRRFNNDVTATHSWLPTTALGLTTAAGFRYTSDETETLRAAASDLPPGQTLVGGAILSASQGRAELRTVSWYLEERASIFDRLFINGAVNWDASSAFGADQRTQLFPRLSLSYVIDREPFWQRFGGGVFSSLRLRAAYGQTGGQPPGLYSRFANYVNTSFAGRPALVSSVTAGNPDLKPERQREYEGGFDAGFFEDRAQLELSYYNKKTSDLVLGVPLPPSSGFSSQFQNIGELSNKGVELALNTVNFTRPRFTWRSRFTYAANRSRVEKLVTAADTLVFEAYLNSVMPGQPVGVFYGGTYARTADGKIAYANVVLTRTVKGIRRVDTLNLPVRGRDTLSTGAIVFARRVLGDPNPDFIATLGNSFQIGRNLEVSFLLDGRFGNEVANFTRRITELFGVDKVVEREISGDTTLQTFSLNPAGRSLIYEEYVEDGTYIKLREIAVQFHVAPGLLRRLGAQRATVRLAGRNLKTWTDYRGLDPEINMFSASTVSRGLDFATTPLPRQFSIGISLGY